MFDQSGISYPNAKTATVINQISEPLIITDAKGTNLGNFITEANQLTNLTNFNPIFLFYLFPEFQTDMTKQYNAKIIKVPEKGVPLLKVLLE